MADAEPGLRHGDPRTRWFLRLARATAATDLVPAPGPVTRPAPRPLRSHPCPTTMRHPSLSAIAALARIAACSSSSDSDVTARANATLRDVDNATVGTVQLAELDNGSVDVTIQVQGMTEGLHGVHFHSIGSCDAATVFASAGSHFNPLAKEHGLNNPNGAHAGDMPNLSVAANGTGTLHTTTARITLSAGTISVLDADGAAVVVHAGQDDQVTDPMGNSGARFACAGESTRSP